MEQQTPAVQEPVRYWNRQRRIGVGLAAAGVVSAVLFGSLATGQQAQFTLAETTAGASSAITDTSARSSSG